MSKNDVQKFYVKTHSITKLKYFGTHCGPKGDVMECHKYTGSGKYWIRHINKHGYDDVTTHVIAEFELDDYKSAKQFGVNFSFDNNIVECEAWANLREEDGTNHGKLGTKTKLKISNTLTGHKLSKQTLVKRRKCNAGSLNPMSGRKHSQASKDAMSKSKTGYVMKIISCPHCEKTGGIQNMKRYHLKNCKLNDDFWEEW